MARKGLTTSVAAALIVLLITPIGILGYSMHNPEIQESISLIGGGETPQENQSDGRSAPDQSREIERTPDINAEFTWTPGSPVEGKNVNFWILNNDREFSSVEWDFDDGDTAVGERVSHRFEEARVHTVNVTVETDEGHKAWEADEIEIMEAIEPEPVIDYSADEMRAGEEIYFLAHNSDDPDGNIEGFYWDLDGAKKVGYEVSHVFDSGGSKTIELIVVDDDGLEATRTSEIDLEPANKLPVPKLDIEPELAKTGENVTFDASGSEDRDGSIESYHWRFGETDFYQEGSKVEKEVFNTPGLYEVSLKVEDDEGDTATVSKLVDVTANYPPSAEIEYSPTSPIVDDRVEFVAHAEDEDGEVAEYHWDFNNDGNYDTQGRTPIRYFVSPGKRNVTLKIIDDKGGSNTTKTQVNVRPVDARYPDADFTYNKIIPQEGEYIVFDGTVSSDPNDMIETYSWDFGNDRSYDDFGETVGKTFSTSGEHEVRLRLDDEDGKLDETTKTLDLVKKECQKLEINGKRENKIDILLVGRNYESSQTMEEHFRYYMDFDQEHRGMFDVYPMSDNQHKFNIWMLDAGVGTISDYGEGLVSDSKNYFDICDFADYNVLMSKDGFSYRSFHLENDIYIAEVSNKIKGDAGGFPLTHLWGRAFADLKPEFVDSYRDENVGRPNCAPSKEKAEEWWGDLAEDDPNVGYEQGCGHSEDNWEPHPGETIMSTEFEDSYGPVNERALEEELEQYN